MACLANKNLRNIHFNKKSVLDFFHSLNQSLNSFIYEVFTNRHTGLLYFHFGGFMLFKITFNLFKLCGIKQIMSFCIGFINTVKICKFNSDLIDKVKY